MIDFEEHFYDDDPSIGHPDVRTRLRDVSYFFLGNGHIQAAVQFCPSGEGTPVGLLIMNPEILAKKRESLTMHPLTGLGNTMTRIMSGDSIQVPVPGAVEAQWIAGQKVPCVWVKWQGSHFAVEELFRCPKLEGPVLNREVRVKNISDEELRCRVKTGLPESFVEEEFSLRADEEKRIICCYTLEKNGQEIQLECRSYEEVPLETEQHWEGTAEISFDSPLLDYYYHSARSQLPAVISRTGRVDGSIWQYNREWIRDQAMMAVGLVLSGQQHLAKVMIQRLITEFVTEDGDTIDSSEKRHADEVELDQNGELLYALEQYVLWTGEREIVEMNWDKLRALANFPLKKVFCHPQSGLLTNTREYWERHRAYGIHKGMELAHQLYVSLGLSSAAALAQWIGREKEGLFWGSEARRLKQACLYDERFGLVEKERFIKRRSDGGSVQDSIQALPEAKLPEGVPLSKKGDHFLNPDTSAALPIALGLVAPDSAIATNTMASLETLWNQSWKYGGYGRYHVSSEPDSPGAWPFPSLFVSRAYSEMHKGDRVWKVLRWLDTMPGAVSGTWFEFYGERLAPPFPQVGVPPWTWAEMIILLVHHILGIRPGYDHLLIYPKLLPGIKRVKASFPLRKTRLFLELNRSTRQENLYIKSNGPILRSSEAGAEIAYSGKTINVSMTIPDS
jgi:hypothetical protein